MSAKNLKADISEKEILMFLENKAFNLKQELKRTQDALNALRESFSLSDIKGMLKPATIKAHKTPEIPLIYSSSFKWDSKILYVLSGKKPMLKTEVAEELHKLEPEIDFHKLETIISVRLSVMHKEGDIKAEKDGKKLRYHL